MIENGILSGKGNAGGILNEHFHTFTVRMVELAEYAISMRDYARPILLGTAVPSRVEY